MLFFKMKVTTDAAPKKENDVAGGDRRHLLIPS